MKDNADSDPAPYHSYQIQKYESIKQGIAAPSKEDAAVPCCVLLDAKTASSEKEAAM